MHAHSQIVVLMRQRVLAGDLLGADDTPVRLLDPRHPAGVRTARFWLYYGYAAAPYDVFHFHESRSRDGPQEFLQTFSGWAKVDAYGVSEGVYLDSGDYAEAAISNLRVQNSQPTPVPTIAPAGVAPGLDVATPGPTPTSPIIQPPASNPQPAPDTAQVQTGPVDAGSSASLLQRSSSDTQINFERVRQAFCSGGVIAAGVFLAIALYFGVRRLSRGGQRHPLAGDNY